MTTEHSWPAANDALRATRLTKVPDGRPRMVLDTDTYNEVDDQFALVHALLSPERVALEAVYAAPFHNRRSRGPGDGMEKSLEEIRRVFELVGKNDVPAFAGSTEWLEGGAAPRRCEAVDDLIERALIDGSEDPLYVVAIGAPTNIANALLIEPALVERIVVVWLGGNAVHWPSAREFNLYQDPRSSRVLFDSGVPLIQIPCKNIADHLITTRGEIDRHVRPAGPLGEFLAERYLDYVGDRVGASKVIWDLAATGWLLDRGWSTTTLTHSPILTSEMTWSRDSRRHLVGVVTELDRDGIFADLFGRLASHATR